MSLRWSWKDYWEWFEQLQEDEIKVMAMVELLGDGWMKGLSPNTQIEVMKFAPREILDCLYQMPETFKPETIKWSEIK